MDRREEMFFFAGKTGKRLLGLALHASGPPGRTGIVYCQPFAEEQNQSHAVVARACRAFADAGMPVLRFDYSGCGDSEGELEAASPADWLEEAAAAADLLARKTGVTRIGFWGLRLGAWMALALAARRPETAFALLWQPVTDPGEYYQQFLRQSLASAIAAGGKAPKVKDLMARIEAGETIEVMGYPVGPRLGAGFAALEGRRPWEDFRCPLLLLGIGQGEGPSFKLQAQADALAAAGRDVTLKHLAGEPFWDRDWRWEFPEAAEVSVAWALEKTAGA